jgi:hypothetical protein
MLKCRPEPGHSGRRAIATPKRITQSIRAGKVPRRYGWPDYESAGASQRQAVFAATFRARSRGRAISRFDPILTPCTCRTESPNSRATSALRAPWARRSSNCSRLSEASVSELRCFNGFRLASGVGVATSSERSGLTVGVISTPTPAINASAVRASSNARSRGCVSNALASNHERRRTGSLRTSATTLGSVEGSPGLSSSRVEIGKCAIASALPRGKVA